MSVRFQRYILYPPTNARGATIMVENAPAAAGSTVVTAPFDGSEIATLPTGDEGHVEAALKAANACHRDRDGWGDTSQNGGTAGEVDGGSGAEASSSSARKSPGSG